MGYYENILGLLSIVLILIILFIIVYGCKYNVINHHKKNHYYERFENKNDDKDENQETINNNEDNDNDDKKKDNDEKNNDNLSLFEKTILNGLSNGSVTTEKLTELIKTEKFTEKNLENLINHVETFKGMVN